MRTYQTFNQSSLVVYQIMLKSLVNQSAAIGGLKILLQWLWKIMSNSYVRDTEAVVEISAAPNFIIQDNLARQAKQSKSAKKRALEKGQGRDVGAEVKQEESFEAQKKMYKGARAIHAAVTFLVYRPTPEQLTHACQMLSHSFGSAKVLRERNIAWQLWLETLPRY